MVSKNNLIINTEKTIAMSFYSNQIRHPSGEVIFKNIDTAYTAELRSLGMCITENLKWDT